MFDYLNIISLTKYPLTLNLNGLSSNSFIGCNTGLLVTFDLCQLLPIYVRFTEMDNSYIPFIAIQQ